MSSNDNQKHLIDESCESFLQLSIPKIIPNKVSYFSPVITRPIPGFLVPKKFPCLIKKIPGNELEYDIFLSEETVPKLIEEKRSLFIFYFQYLKLGDYNDAERIYQNYYSSNDNDLQKITELKPYLDISYISITLDLMFKFKITKAIHYFFNQDLDSYYDAFKDSLSEKYFIVNNGIVPALITAKQLKAFASKKSPCTFRMCKDDTTQMINIQSIRPKESIEYIFQLIRELKNCFTNEKDSSIEIFDQVLENFHKITTEMLKRKIIRQHENIFNSLINDPKNINKLPDLIKNIHKKDEYSDESIVNMAYMIASSCLCISLSGHGLNSNVSHNFYGINILVNNLNKGGSIFTISLDRIPQITMQACIEIQKYINEPFQFNQFVEIDKNEDVKIWIQKSMPFLNSISTKYKEYLRKNIEEKHSLTNQLVDRVQNTVENAADTSKSIIEKANICTYQGFLMSQIKDEIESKKNVIKSLESIKGLVHLIEIVPQLLLANNIYGIRIEQIGDEPKINGIFINFEQF